MKKYFILLFTSFSLLAGEIKHTYFFHFTDGSTGRLEVEPLTKKHEYAVSTLRYVAALDNPLIVTYHRRNGTNGSSVYVPIGFMFNSTTLSTESIIPELFDDSRLMIHIFNK